VVTKDLVPLGADESGDGLVVGVKPQA